MKKNIFLLVLSTLLCLSISSCDKDDSDTTKPVINLHEPEDGDSLRIGESIHFECDFSDNEQLGSYMIEIHNNFDGHSHKLSSTPAGETVPFSAKFSASLSGLRNTHIHHHEIKIPLDATPGTYHFLVYCTDEAGNQTLVARDVILSNEASSHDHGEDHDHND